MRTFICVAMATAFAFAGTQEAAADAEAGQGYFSIMLSYMDDDKERGLEDGINGFQFGLGKALNENWNIEGMLSVAAPDATLPGVVGQQQMGIGVDVQRVFQRSERFSPYLHAGLGYIEISPNGAVPSDTGAMYSAGIGFLLDAFSSNVALKGEWRYRVDTSSSDRDYKDNILSLGLQIPFGPGTPKWTDSDGDGVEDGSDNCPNTPAGASVDAWGCELDSDGDGVKDSLDQCPGTPAGQPVDQNGCELDDDNDGVVNRLDECPETPAGEPVDEKGCELDDDNDGVVNRLDECPGTPEGTPVDRRGCEIEGEYVLQGVNFESNSDVLLASASSVLDQVTETLLKYPQITFAIEGHTDSDGAADYNEGLSTRRAQTVYDYFAGKGVAEDRMTVRGFGETQPIADNTTAAGKAENRRVVLSVIEN